MIKKFLQNNYIQNFVGFVISLYIKICFHTSLWYVRNNKELEKHIEKNSKIIVIFWHSRLLMAPFCWNYSNNFKMLISSHRDGRIISRAVSHLGIETIQGSSNKNKISSAKQIINELNQKNIIGITPDGPRGPNQKIKEGLISMQKKTNSVIFPLCYSAKFYKRLSSWDKFMFVYPFNKFVAVWGNPIIYNKKKSLTQNISIVQNELDRVTMLSKNLSK
jgi:hypothetical protein